MDIAEIEVGHVYFDYGNVFPRKVLEINDGTVICCNVSCTHDFIVCPIATRYQLTLEEFAEWAQIRLTTKELNVKTIV